MQASLLGEPERVPLGPIGVATAEVESQDEDLAQAESQVHRGFPTQVKEDVPLIVLDQAPAVVEPLVQAEAEAPAQAQDLEQEAKSATEPISASSLSVEEGHSISDTAVSSSELDSSGNSVNEADAADALAGPQASVPRERRDSGVGASLTRPCR